MGEGVDRADWACATLGELFELKYGKGLPKDSRVSGDVPVYGSNGLVGWHSSAVSLAPCVLVGRKGAAGKVHFSCVPCWPIDTTYFVDDFQGLEAKFFFYLMRSLQLNKLETSTAIPGLNRDDAYRETVSLPPLVEQRAIVAKIEALFSELDKGVEQLETLKGQLKRYRQSVLKAAFDGKLTAEWRAERARPFVQDREQLKVAETPATYGTKKHPPLTEEELAELPELPEGWRWVRLGSTTHLVGGVTKGRKLEGREVIELPYLRVANVQDGYLDLSEMKTILLPVSEKAKYLLKVGDVLYIEGGDKDKLGRGSVWRGEISECIHQNHVFRARPYDSMVPTFLGAFSQTQTARNYFFRHAKQTVNLASINMTLLSCLPVPMPPKDEQRQIVAEIEARFSALDQLEQTVEAGLKQAEALRQSILKKAFEGRLLSASERAAVRADPGYEPAARLLERIRAERTAQSGQGGQRGRATKSRSLSTPSTPSTSSTPPTPKRRPGP